MIRFRLLLFLTVTGFACGDAAEKNGQQTVEAPRAPSVYYFYPKANVYFDSANKEYVFQTGDSGWMAQKQIPAAVQTLMDKGVLIDSPANPVWADNANHRLIYSAVLYASPTDTVEKKPVVVKSDTVVKTEKKRSGIRRFFDKIFGKRDKKKRTG